jgi:hypothetical protein
MIESFSYASMQVDCPIGLIDTATDVPSNGGVTLPTSTSSRSRGVLIGAVAALIVLAIVVAVLQGFHRLPFGTDTAQGPPTVVYGHLFARVEDASAPGGARDVLLPGIGVELRGSKHRASAGVTNARGMFTSPALPPDTYQVCWQSDGFDSGCTGPDRRIVVDKTTTISGPIEIKPKPGFVTGKVTPCGLQDPIFRIDLGTTVTLVNA